MSWIDRISDSASPGSPALCDGDGEWISHGALQDRVARQAEALAAQGLGAGDRMMLVAENGAEFVTLFLAAARLRAWAVPVNARLTAGELDRLIAHADPRLIAYTARISPAAAEHAARRCAGDTPESRPGATREPASDDPARQVAAMLYTSGTTGAPKGVMLSHRTLAFNAEIATRMRALTARDELLLVLPCTHIMALSTVILAALRAGARLRLMPRFSPEVVLDALARGASILPMVPAMYDALLRHLDSTGQPLAAPALRQIGTGGAPLDPGWKRRIEARFGLVLNNGYGLTEAGPGIASTLLGPPRSDSSVGHPYPGCEIRLDGCGSDGAGELLVRGPNVMLGYFRDPKATAQAITSEGFLRTGDLARIDGDGAIHIVGRAKELIIRSGFNVYPPEIESALAACPGVVQVAVAGRAVPGNEEIVAFVTTDGSLTEAALRDWARAQLTGYKRPQHLVFVDAMPMTAAGKVRKQELLAQYDGALPAAGS